MTASHIVSPSHIQSELDALWNSLENIHKLRASLFNLVFYTKKSPRDEYIQRIAQKIIEKFPARIFFISSDPDPKQDYIKTAVSVISAKQGEFDITCDFIEISVGGKGEEQVPFIILPHMIPDLPVFLVWAEDPTRNSKLCAELQKMATRLIFDSETASNLPEFAKATLKIKQSSHCEIADLNWARLESWRDLLSASFKDPEQLEKLQKVKTLRITYNAQETPFFCHTRIQSLYLQSWLASRLNWKMEKSSTSKDKLSFLYSKDGAPISVILEPVRHTELPPGLIVSLSLETSDQDHFTFTRSVGAPNQISFEYSTNHSCKLPTKFLFAKGESGQSLVKEICHKGTSRHYLDVLTTISRMESLSLC